MKRIVSTDKAPAAIGPYSQAVAAAGFLYVSGQLPIDPVSGAFHGDTAAEQASQALDNIGAILAEAGYGFEDVVKTTVYLSDIADFAAMNEEYAKRFKRDCPARAAFEVAALPKAALVEIEAIAFKG